MANWNRPVITNQGLELINNSLNNGTIRITSVKMSSDRLSGDLRSKTSIANIKKSVNPSSVSKIEDKIKVSAILTNQGNSTGYNLETIGIYATGNSGEILFGLITAQDSDHIPADNGSGVITINFELFFNVNRNANFSINYTSDALLTVNDLNAIVEQKMLSKANKNEVVSDISVSGNILTFTKNSKQTSLTLAQDVPDATDTVAGKISKNSVKEIINATVPRISDATDTVAGKITLNTVKSIVDTKVTDSRIKKIAETKFNELINAKRARLDDIWAGV